MNKQELIEQGWAIIDGFPCHRITIDGRVQVKTSLANGYAWRDLRAVKKRIGYVTINLGHKKFKKSFKVHRLVAIAFIDNLELKKEVNHKDGVKDNNLVHNLEWVTRSENMKHAFRSRLALPRKGESHWNSSLSDNDVRNIRELIAKKVMLKEIAKIFNTSARVISSINTGEGWRHVST